MTKPKNWLRVIADFVKEGENWILKLVWWGRKLMRELDGMEGGSQWVTRTMGVRGFPSGTMILVLKTELQGHPLGIPLPDTWYLLPGCQSSNTQPLPTLEPVLITPYWTFISYWLPAPRGQGPCLIYSYILSPGTVPWHILGTMNDADWMHEVEDIEEKA